MSHMLVSTLPRVVFPQMTVKSNALFDIVEWSLLRYQPVSRLNLPSVEHVTFEQENPEAECVFESLTWLQVPRIDQY